MKTIALLTLMTIVVCPQGAPPSKEPPGGLLPSEVPQFITIGSDDNNSGDGVNFLVDELMDGRFNPAGTDNPATFDGTPVRASFYFIGVHERAGGMVCDAHRNVYLKGHEIGVHGYAHEVGFDEAGWREDVAKALDYLTRDYRCDDDGNTINGLGVPRSEIHGWRTPMDAYSPELFRVLQEFGFVYDCSLSTGFGFLGEDATNHTWPGTLDQGWPASFPDSPGNFAGLWELPQSRMDLPPDLGGEQIGYCDSDWFWKTPDRSVDRPAAEIATILKYNLDRHLGGNRAPLHLCLHGNAWGRQEWEVIRGIPRSTRTSERQAALTDFLDYALSKPEVRVVRQIDVVGWMRDPAPLGELPEPTPPATPPGGGGSGRCGALGVEALLAMFLVALMPRRNS
ncbi:MAG: hypothetical protein HYY16_06400 [Planctomycetes bacterium]|nr:hypothetical protein [Planctomycetota bacterium]